MRALLLAAVALLALGATDAHEHERRRHTHARRSQPVDADWDADDALTDEERDLWEGTAPAQLQPSGDHRLPRGSIQLAAFVSGAANRTIASHSPTTLPATPGLEVGLGADDAAPAVSAAPSAQPASAAVALVAQPPQAPALDNPSPVDPDSVRYLGAGGGTYCVSFGHRPLLVPLLNHSSPSPAHACAAETSATTARLDAMDKALKQLLGSVDALSAAVGATFSAGGSGGGGGGPNEYVGGYKQGFADGYSHGFHEAKMSKGDEPPTPATSDLAAQVRLSPALAWLQPLTSATGPRASSKGR